MANFEVHHQEVTIVPVDINDRVLMFTDVKIVNVDSEYRTVKDTAGLSWKLAPGEYKARIFLRNLQMKIIPLKVKAGVSVYRLPVITDQQVPAVAVREKPFATKAPLLPSRPNEKQRCRRFVLQFPVEYRINSGQWIPSKSINLSTAGVCVENSGHVKEDDTLYVKMHVPISSVPIECPARVAWIRSKNVARPEAGLQLFLTANMRSSIESWLSMITRP